MEDIKTEPVDFVKEFQEYLTQQTQHVNMISGSVCAEKGPDESFQAGAPKSKQNGLDPSVDVSGSLEDGGELQMDGLERTPDGKYKCSYCNYANKGMARLIEHIRIHTGEKPHRCQLCPFASAYERHLEAHMRSHTGEKPYKCDLCAFRCSDRSNLSHHRRRRHKLVPVRAVRSAFANKRVLGVLQKRSYSLGFGKRLVFSNFSPAPMAVPKADYLNDFSRVLNHHMGGDESAAKVRDGGNRGANGFGSGNPLEQLSTLAADLPRPANETQSLDRPPDGAPAPCNDEKPILIQQVSGAPVAVSTKEVQTLQSLKYHCSEQSSYGMEESNSYDDTPHDLSAGAGVSQPSASTPALSTQDFQGVPLLHICQHCDVRFSDNVLYTIHMGCHGCENPFQCNICGFMCRDKYDFACHFARGQHKK